MATDPARDVALRRRLPLADVAAPDPLTRPPLAGVADAHELAALERVAAWAPNTRRAYTAAWKRWTAWAAARGVAALPADARHVRAYILDHAARGVIFYVGDFDPSGLEIDRDAEGKLRRYIDRLGGDPDWLEFRRLAITAAQIEHYALPTKPRKPSERRRPDVLATVEAEAMPAGDLRAIVRSAVESYLPAGALQAARIAEESERAGLLALYGTRSIKL